MKSERWHQYYTACVQVLLARVVWQYLPEVHEERFRELIPLAKIAADMAEEETQ